MEDGLTGAGEPPPTIALLTDFGRRDAYVGVLHGVIRRIAPRAAVIDLCHEVPPQDLHAAGFVLDNAVDYFPPETIHVGVIDPGVGTDRRIICVETPVGRFVVPDNGLITRVLARHPARRVVSVEERAYCLPEVSTTFHGRDVFAPVAAHLARGVPTDALGPALDPGELVRLAQPQPSATGPGSLRCEVAHVDHFGNLITNLPNPRAGGVRAVQAGDTRISGPPVPSYGHGAPGALLLVLGSSGFLELAQRGGSAAARLQAARGTPLEMVLDEGSPVP